MNDIPPDKAPRDEHGEPLASDPNPDQQEIGNSEDAEKALAAKYLSLEQRGKSGANWFYWVAGLSMINSVILLTGGNTFFVIGLGITLIADSIATGIAQETPHLADVARGIALGFDLLVAVIVVGFGWLAIKRYLTVFVIGMVLYLMDGLIFLQFQDWMSVGFHAFALVCMWNGFSAYRQMNEVEKALQSPQ